MKKKKIIFTIICTFIILILIFVKLISLPKKFDKAQRQWNENYPSLNYENEVSQRLKQLNIPHKIDKDGVLCYFGKDQDIVERAYEEVDKKYFPEWPNIYFANKEHRDYFVELLEKENIRYIIRKLDAKGGDYILWDPIYNDRGLELKKKVLGAPSFDWN